MEIDEHVRYLDEAGHRLLRAVRWGSLSAPVPTCPEWDVADLLRHLCEVHSWATWILQGGNHREHLFTPPSEDDLIASYEKALGTLIDTFVRVPDDLDVWYFLPAPSAKAFWARRQAHELTMHAIDAEIAVDCGITDVPLDLAVDGLDELLSGFAPKRIKAGAVDYLRAIMFAPIDANISWTVDIGPDEPARTLQNAPNVADLSIMAGAADLYRWAWNRASDQEVSLHGDVTLADLWRTLLRIRWS